MKLKYVKVGALFGLHAGDDSVGVRVRLGTVVGELQFVIGVVRVGRVASIIGETGPPGVQLTPAVLGRGARTVAARMRAGLVPVSTAPPALTGVSQVGQVLTIVPGKWLNAPPAFTYAWQRCDLTGAACVPIAGATADSYTVTADDVGSTVVASIGAANPYGARNVSTAPTAAVGVAGAPSSTGAPTVSGSSSVGQTLTATTGAWSGAPTAFAYQWRRCAANGTGCVDVSGAAAATYAVTAADTGSTLRVVVTASNASGPALAISAATDVVAQS